MALYIQLSTQNVFTKYLSISSITGGNSVNTDQLTSTVVSLITNTVVPPFISTQGLFASSVTTSSIIANSITSGVMSTLVLYASSIVGVQTGGGGGPAGPIPYLSSFSLSTGYIFSPLQLGTVSTVNTFEFNGLFGNYNNTVLAEISTGGGSQELLVFKGSSVSDRVRVQTTGDVIFETGVSARLWSDTTVPTLSNTTPAMIINSSSNVGIQTATPATALDVAGTGRFITASSISMFTGALYTGVYFI